jgi:diguanylate cyclase
VTTHRRLDAIFAALMLVVAVLFLPRMFLQDTVVFGQVLSDQVVLVIGSVVKLAFLLVAALLAGRIVPHFSPGNRARPAWRLMQLGFGTYFLGQVTLSSLNIMLDKPPFPSPADALFTLGMLFLIASLAVFVSAYLREGLVDSPTGVAATAVALVLAAGVFDFWLLTPIVRGQGPVLETVVNVAYPALDSVVLVLAAVLLRITLRFRGGSLWKVWFTLLCGFVFLCAADISYAYLATKGMSSLDPIMDVLFVWSYALLARGTLYQHELLAE